MKKTILTALLAMFVMVGFANHSTPLKVNSEEVKIEKIFKKHQPTENKSGEVQTPQINSPEQVNEVCFEFPMCGFSGWACGDTITDAVNHAVIAYIWHCLY